MRSRTTKTRAVEADTCNAALRVEVMELRNQTKKDLRQINARLNQCEANTFAQDVEWRQTQEQTPACGREAIDNIMLAVCCGSRARAGNKRPPRTIVGAHRGHPRHRL